MDALLLVLLSEWGPAGSAGLMVTSVYAFILAWNDFMFANTFINSDPWHVNNRYRHHAEQLCVQWGAMTAAATVTTLPY